MQFDDYHIDIAKVVSTKSKDPSSKIGAVIVGPEKQIIATGFNGFPRGIDETDLLRWERDIKYRYIEHAERNAVYNAARHGISLRGCTMYVYGYAPCTECAKAIIQSGITRVVIFSIKEVPERWVSDIGFARALLTEAGIKVEKDKRGM